MPEFSEIEGTLESAMLEISEKQQIYLRDLGKYVQFLNQDSRIVAVDSKYDQVDARHKIELPDGETIASINVYETPLREHGCWVILRTHVDKVLYERSVTLFGPEDRNEDWHPVVPESRKQDII